MSMTKIEKWLNEGKVWLSPLVKVKAPDFDRLFTPQDNYDGVALYTTDESILAELAGLHKPGLPTKETPNKGGWLTKSTPIIGKTADGKPLYRFKLMDKAVKELSDERKEALKAIAPLNENSFFDLSAPEGIDVGFVTSDGQTYLVMRSYTETAETLPNLLSKDGLKNGDFHHIHCKSGGYVALVPVPDALAEAIKRADKEVVVFDVPADITRPVFIAAHLSETLPSKERAEPQYQQKPKIEQIPKPLIPPTPLAERLATLPNHAVFISAIRRGDGDLTRELHFPTDLAASIEILADAALTTPPLTLWFTGNHAILSEESYHQLIEANSTGNVAETDEITPFRLKKTYVKSTQTDHRLKEMILLPGEEGKYDTLFIIANHPHWLSTFPSRMQAREEKLGIEKFGTEDKTPAVMRVRIPKTVGDDIRRERHSETLNILRTSIHLHPISALKLLEARQSVEGLEPCEKSRKAQNSPHDYPTLIIADRAPNDIAAFERELLTTLDPRPLKREDKEPKKEQKRAQRKSAKTDEEKNLHHLERFLNHTLKNVSNNTKLHLAVVRGDDDHYYAYLRLPPRTIPDSEMKDKEFLRYFGLESLSVHDDGAGKHHDYRFRVPMALITVIAKHYPAMVSLSDDSPSDKTQSEKTVINTTVKLSKKDAYERFCQTFVVAQHWDAFSEITPLDSAVNYILSHQARIYSVRNPSTEELTDYRQTLTDLTNATSPIQQVTANIRALLDKLSQIPSPAVDDITSNIQPLRNTAQATIQQAERSMRLATAIEQCMAKHQQWVEGGRTVTKELVIEVGRSDSKLDRMFTNLAPHMTRQAELVPLRGKGERKQLVRLFLDDEAMAHLIARSQYIEAKRDELSENSRYRHGKLMVHDTEIPVTEFYQTVIGDFRPDQHGASITEAGVNHQRVIEKLSDDLQATKPALASIRFETENGQKRAFKAGNQYALMFRLPADAATRADHIARIDKLAKALDDAGLTAKPRTYENISKLGEIFDYDMTQLEGIRHWRQNLQTISNAEAVFEHIINGQSTDESALTSAISPLFNLFEKASEPAEHITRWRAALSKENIIASPDQAAQAISEIRDAIALKEHIFRRFEARMTTAVKEEIIQQLNAVEPDTDKERNRIISIIGELTEQVEGGLVRSPRLIEALQIIAAVERPTALMSRQGNSIASAADTTEQRSGHAAKLDKRGNYVALFVSEDAKSLLETLGSRYLKTLPKRDQRQGFKPSTTAVYEKPESPHTIADWATALDELHAHIKQSDNVRRAG